MVALIPVLILFSKLEEVGGIEYRALRVLGYLVFTVSPRYQLHLCQKLEISLLSYLVLHRDAVHFLHHFRSLYVHKVQRCI